MGFIRLMCCMLFVFLCGEGLAKDKALDLSLRDTKYADIRPLGFPGPSEVWQDTFPDTRQSPTMSFRGNGESTSVTDIWCKSITRTFWSNSRHPGGDRGGRLNQENRGIGFKCRIEKDNPVYFSLDTLTNSQRGASMAASMGKQLDLVNLYGVKYYVGLSATLLSYEMPRRRKTVYGIVPMPHRGVSYEVPYGWGTIGWEEQFLPQGIKLRSWNFLLKKRVNIF